MLSRSSRSSKKVAPALARVVSTKAAAPTDDIWFKEPTMMSNSEAFVETLRGHGVTTIFGIVGSAFMDPLDIFPPGGIRFVPNAHEQGSAHMADGYSRVTGKHGVCIGQNGPGISNMVTGIAAAYWAHSPVVMITPEAGTMTVGWGGFQEMDQLPVFSTVTKFQAHIRSHSDHHPYPPGPHTQALINNSP